METPAQSPYIPPVTSDPNSPNRFNEDSATYAVRGSETPDPRTA